MLYLLSLQSFVFAPVTRARLPTMCSPPLSLWLLRACLSGLFVFFSWATTTITLLTWPIYLPRPSEKLILILFCLSMTPDNTRFKSAAEPNQRPQAQETQAERQQQHSNGVVLRPQTDLESKYLMYNLSGSIYLRTHNPFLDFVFSPISPPCITQMIDFKNRQMGRMV